MKRRTMTRNYCFRRMSKILLNCSSCRRSMTNRSSLILNYMIRCCSCYSWVMSCFVTGLSIALMMNVKEECTPVNCCYAEPWFC